MYSHPSSFLLSYFESGEPRSNAEEDAHPQEGRTLVLLPLGRDSAFFSEIPLQNFREHCVQLLRFVSASVIAAIVTFSNTIF